MHILAVFLMLGLPAFADVGSEGVLTSQSLQRCMENSNPTSVQLTEQIMTDEMAGVPGELQSIHRLQLEIEKLRCVYSALSGYAFGIGLTVENVEEQRGYRVVISQLALYAGAKHFELEKIESTPSCTQVNLEERALCLKARQIFLIQGHALVDAIDDFVAGYSDAVANRPKFWMYRMEARVERGVQEKIKHLTEKLAVTPTPASLR